MGGEFPNELARNFVRAIAIFFNANGFKVDETSYEGGDAATVRLPGDTLVRFDILMSKREEGSLSAEHYYCEAKWRTEIGDLKRQFKTFLGKSRQVMEDARRRYNDGFGFLFFTDLYFGITNSEVKSFEHLKTLVNDAAVSDDELRKLSDKVTIVILEKWLLEKVTGERVN